MFLSHRRKKSYRFGTTWKWVNHFWINYPLKDYFLLHDLGHSSMSYFLLFCVDKMKNICHSGIVICVAGVAFSYSTLSVEAHQTDTFSEVYAVLTRPCLLHGSGSSVSRVWVCVTANLLNNFHSSYGCPCPSLSLSLSLILTC